MSGTTKVGGLAAMAYLALFTPSPASAQPKSAAQLLEQARPHLEAVVGQRLDVSVRPVTAADLRQVPDPELAAQVVWQFPDLHGNRFLGTAFQTAKDALRSATPALVDPRNGDILWQPEATTAIAAWNTAVARAESESFAQLALVHAVVCRHLDRHYNLGRRWQQCRDAEEFQVLQTVRAGRAMWLTRQVARRLESDSFVPLLVQCYRYVPDPPGDNAVRHVCREVLRRQYAAAIDGLSICDYLEEKQFPGIERCLFERPPRQLAWLSRPELYVKAQQSTRHALADSLRRLEASPPAADWKASEQPWTPDMVNQVAALLGQRPQADKVLRKWNEARTVLWSDPRDAGKQVALSVVRFEDEAGARAYFNFANDLQRKRDEISNAADAGLLRVVQSRTEACALAGAAEAVRFEKVLQGDAKAPPVTEKKFLACGGDTVIELAWYGVVEDAAWAERTIGALLKP